MENKEVFVSGSLKAKGPKYTVIEVDLYKVENSEFTVEKYTGKEGVILRQVGEAREGKVFFLCEVWG